MPQIPVADTSMKQSGHTGRGLSSTTLRCGVARSRGAWGARVLRIGAGAADGGGAAAGTCAAQ
ncbi:hypothetical protein FBY40_2836 [Microbacterium sp. SLBN-154]|nr:hypothetical protein FBY40_2836 [Microbacterium sp. SLBN-154]